MATAPVSGSVGTLIVLRGRVLAVEGGRPTREQGEGIRGGASGLDVHGHVEVEFVGRGEIISMVSSRAREGSPGVNGGAPGIRQQQQRRKTDGTIETIGGLSDEGQWLPQMLGGVPFAPGESFVFYSGGGGGWGSALERDPELVAEDVRNEIVSPEAARDTYGVVLTDDGQVDMDATTAAGRAVGAVQTRRRVGAPPATLAPTKSVDASSPGDHS